MKTEYHIGDIVLWQDKEEWERIKKEREEMELRFFMRTFPTFPMFLIEKNR